MTNIKLDSIGIELEFEDVLSGLIAKDRRLSGFVKIKKDHSCESPGLTCSGYKLDSVDSNKYPLLEISPCILGGEITTSIMDTEEGYLEPLKFITGRLIELGESPCSYKSSFHVHVNMPYNLKMLKNVLKLSLHLEQVFFMLGGMGYDYRGKLNNSIYCRPITGKGPIVVPVESEKFSPVFVIEDLLNSKDNEEFKQRYGDFTNVNGRYIPVRYHWINFIPIFGQGSLEFRVFNKSLNPYYLWAIVEFCKMFVDFCFSYISKHLELEENSIYQLQDKGYIVKTFHRFIDNMEYNNEQIIGILEDILLQSDYKSILLEENYMRSHLEFHRGGNLVSMYWTHKGYKPKLKIPAEIVKIPGMGY